MKYRTASARRKTIYHFKEAGVIKFIVEGTAVPKQRPRISGRQAYTPKRTKDYEERVRQAFCSSHRGPLPVYAEGTPVRASIEIIRKIPKSWTKARQLAAATGLITPTARNGDLDNFAKSILDALNGYVYQDDCQVTTLIISKRYGHQARAIVRFDEDER